MSIKAKRMWGHTVGIVVDHRSFHNNIEYLVLSNTDGEAEKLLKWALFNLRVHDEDASGINAILAQLKGDGDGD